MRLNRHIIIKTMNDKKYKLTKESKIVEGVKVFRIKALQDFGNTKTSYLGIVEKGDLGGFVERECNLSQYSKSWIRDEAVALGTSTVSGNAILRKDGIIKDNVEVSDNAMIEGIVSDDSEISGNAIVRGSVSGNSNISDNAIVSVSGSVSGNSNISGNAIVNGKVRGASTIEGNVIIETNGNLNNACFFENEKIDFDVSNNKLGSYKRDMFKHLEGIKSLSTDWAKTESYPAPEEEVFQALYILRRYVRNLDESYVHDRKI